VNPTRRSVLAGLAAAGCAPDPSRGGAVPPGEPPSPWDPAGTVDRTAFPCGVQTGDATPDGIVASVRTDLPAFDLVLARGDALGWTEVERLRGVPAADGGARVVLDGLDPDTTHALVAVDGGTRSTAARFRTALPPGSRRRVRFAATSCLGNDDVPWPSLRRVTEEGPLDALLLLGDTIYVDVRRDPAATYAARWRRALGTDGLAAATSATSVIASWDDHEVANDWTWETDGRLVRPAVRAFRDALPQRRGPGGLGTWRRLSWGDAVDVFVLDARSERSEGKLVSDEQLAWLIDGLRDSRAACKLVAGGVPISDLSGLYVRSENQGWLPHAQRTPLLEAAAEVPGVVWLGGDIHWGAVARVGRPGEPGDGQTEIICGPAGSKVTMEAATAVGDPRFDAVVLAHHTALLELDPDAGEVAVTFVGDEGPLRREVIDLAARQSHRGRGREAQITR
jgi:phosphodiesterase/alkaline phosphatase D-like protein